MISSDIDLGKARTMLYYLGQGLRSLQHRDEQKQKLHVVLKQLKNLNTETVKTEIGRVEGELKELIEKENRILRRQGKEENLHEKISRKITVLEHKLGRYIQTRHKQHSRRKELEAKVRRVYDVPKLMRIKDRLEILHKKLNEIHSRKEISIERFNQMQGKISRLKRMVKI